MNIPEEIVEKAARAIHEVDDPFSAEECARAALEAAASMLVAQALNNAADDWLHGAWGNTPRRQDRIADRIAAAQYAGDWMRSRAEQIKDQS